MKRYQNPEVFEPLAMAYALGTLQGQARQRFKALMSRHFYLRVVTEAYERQFSGLVDLLPQEEPSPEVWKRLEAELDLTRHKQINETGKGGGGSVWREWLHLPAMALASVMAAVITFFVLSGGQPDVYFARLNSAAGQSVAMASVSKKEMKITIALADKLSLDKGLTPTLWCFSKKPEEAPIRMGSLNPSGKSQLPIDEKIWNGLSEVGQLAITLEPVDSTSNTANPSGEMLFVGELMSGKE